MASLLPLLGQLDALVAERVMGWSVRRDGNSYYCTQKNGGFFVPRFSSDMGAAWQVVEELAKNGLVVEIRHNAKGKFQVTGVNCWRETRRPEEVIDPSAPIAICLAALRFVGVEVELLEGARL